MRKYFFGWSLLFLGLPVVGIAISLTDSGLTLAPYLQRQTKHAVTILARSDEAQTITLNYRKVGATNWKTKTEDNAVTDHRYRLTSLKRETTYEYFLENSSGESLTQTYNFDTQKDTLNEDPLHVAAFGDSGMANTAQYEVASEITAWQPELMLHTGDIAYYSGTEQEFIDKVFTVYSNLFSEIPFYASIGNHDFVTELAGPYKELFETPTNGDDEDYYSFNYDNIHFVSLNSSLDYSVGSTMYTWLENDLATTDKKWVIVFFHYPPYSSGGHGSTVDMQTTIVPLFEEYNVDLVLNGHDHSYERFEKINGVQYIVTGGGGGDLYQMTTELPESAFFLAQYHFVGLTISPDELKIEAIDKGGFVFDTITLE
ncbi:MAG: Ser/Thr protein phosphatase family protein [uncultured bacterium]|nr:MAG: Ser/Thr protein phosphatase family protein [uncultured bacterium]